MRSTVLVLVLVGFMARAPALGAGAEDREQGQQSTEEAELMVSRLDLPDPLTMNDGRKVTTLAQWRIRREEMKKILIENLVGDLPPPPGNVEGTETSSTLLPADWQAVLDFADVHLLGKQVSRRFDQFPPDQLLQ